MEETKTWIKTAKVNDDVKHQKAEKELQRDIEGYFKERDKTNRGLETKISEATEMSKSEAEVKELLYNDSLKPKQLPPTIKPMFNQVFLSAKRNKVRTESGLWMPSATFGTDKETDASIDYQVVQEVMAIGDQVQELAVGMEVILDMELFKRRVDGNLSGVVRKQTEYVIPVKEILGNEYIKVSEREIDFIIDTNNLTNPNKK